MENYKLGDNPLNAEELCLQMFFNDSVVKDDEQVMDGSSFHQRVNLMH